MVQNKEEASEVITKSAFFQARKQLSYTAFQALNRQVVNEVYQSDWKPKTWKGFHLFAIDGTSIRLPNEPNITEYFSLQKGREGQGECSMGMVSIFYDILNKIMILFCLIEDTLLSGCIPIYHSITFAFVCEQKQTNLYW